MTRRTFLSASAALALPAQPQQQRPNILFAIADDWSWPFATIAGRTRPRTPNFDRVAKQGVLFTNAFVSAPSCTPSRGAILTGQMFYRLGEASNLTSYFRPNHTVYPDVLENAGYHVGFTGKGWSPGVFNVEGRTRNPAGPVYNEIKLKPPTTGISPIDYAANFEDFLSKRKPNQPFCFWYGGIEPHLPYERGSGQRNGLKPADVMVPSHLPDNDVSRGDMMDYAFEIEWFDTQLGKMLAKLEQMGELNNTLVVVTGDNGLPFPRAKTNIYDAGTHVPLAACWLAKAKPGRRYDHFISLTDLAPTFLEAAGLKPQPQMTAHSFLDLLTTGKSATKRDYVVTGRERHVLAQPDSIAGYPMRAYRTADYLYIRNYKPERWPVGAEGPNTNPPPNATLLNFRDTDESPTKQWMLAHREDAQIKPLFNAAFAKRPAEELYDLRTDPDQQRNVASDPKYARTLTTLRTQLTAYQKQTSDPRETGKGDAFDTYPWAR